MLPTPQQEIRPEEVVPLQLMHQQAMRLEELEMHQQQEIRLEVVEQLLMSLQTQPPEEIKLQVEQQLAIRQHQLSQLVPLT